MKVGKKCFLVFGCWLLVAGFWLMIGKTQADSWPEQKNIAIITQYPAVLKASIQRMIGRQELDVDEINSLDFSLPGDPAYGDDPQYEVFNPKGGNGNIIDESNIENYKDLSETPYYIFTLGDKVEGAGTEKSDLIAIMPNIYKFVCEAVQRGYSKDYEGDALIPRLATKPNLTPHPAEIPELEIVTLPSNFGCVEGSDGLYYYYHLLFER